MQYSQLSQKTVEHFEKKLPFVLYSMPNTNTIIGVFQNTCSPTSAENLFEDSFVLAPFNTAEQLFQISIRASEVLCCDEIPQFLINETTTAIDERQEDKIEHIRLVKNAIKKIKTGSAQKIVVSRKKELRLQEFNLQKLCDSLFSQHATAFRYIWYHPETHIWCGATPEVLIETKGPSFSTMALAGTQKLNGKSIIFWDKKEKSEQQWVVDAIVDNLLYKTTALTVSKTQTHIAGNLAHLRTDIKGVLHTSKIALKNVIDALHPTPAVCGTPKKQAKAFILENEGYDREFYSGFLGVSNAMENETNLFVNLRCVKIEASKATLYAGGGITIDSNPEDEWEETHNKLQTMAKVLQPLL
jgi:isochorismate synthase